MSRYSTLPPSTLRFFRGVASVPGPFTPERRLWLEVLCEFLREETRPAALRRRRAAHPYVREDNPDWVMLCRLLGVDPVETCRAALEALRRDSLVCSGRRAED